MDKNEQDSDAVDNLLAGLGVHLLRAWQLGHLDHDPGKGPGHFLLAVSRLQMELIAEAKELEAVDDVPHDGRVAEVARGCVQPRLAVVTAYLWRRSVVLEMAVKVHQVQAMIDRREPADIRAAKHSSSHLRPVLPNLLPAACEPILWRYLSTNSINKKVHRIFYSRISSVEFPSCQRYSFAFQTFWIVFCSILASNNNAAVHCTAC